MTLQTIFEKLKVMFPRATEQLIIQEIDVAQKRFVTRTKILKQAGELSGITSYISFALPDDFKSLRGIYYYDSDGNPIYEEELTIAAEVHIVSSQKKLTFRSTTLTPISSLPAEIAYIQIEYYKSPTAITTRNSTFSIPEDYWSTIEKMVMIELHRMFPRAMEVNGRTYESIDWKGIERLEFGVRRDELQAIADRNVGDDDRDYDVSFYSHAGEHYKALRSRTTASTISIEGEDLTYSKYYRVIVEDDNSYEVQSKTGFGTINVAVTAGTPVITITSPSNEFTSDPATWVYSNQGTPYIWNSAGSITFTPYSTDWGTMEIEIYIYEQEAT